MKRILVYSHDTFGLGNIRRLLTISSYLVNAHPDASILIVSGSPMLHAFRLEPRIDYVKVPCLERKEADGYAVKSLALNLDETLQLRANIILSTVIDFAPDVLLVDKKPLGVGRELAPTFEFFNRRGESPKIVLLLRDILDTPERTIEIWKRNRYFDVIDTYYDRVLVAGSPEVFDLPRVYQFPSTTAQKVEFCGYLAREPGLRSRDAVRTALGLNGERLVVVTTGGGKDGEQLITSYLKGLKSYQPAPQFNSLILCGPELPYDKRRPIKSLAQQCRNVQVEEFTDDMMSYIGAADLVVSMAGYNTICEILSLKKRAIVVPRTVPVKEQWIRARRMSELGLLRTIDPEQVTPKRLMKCVSEELGKSNIHSSGLYQADLNGLPEIDRVITALFNTIPGETPPRVDYANHGNRLYRGF